MDTRRATRSLGAAIGLGAFLAGVVFATQGASAATSYTGSGDWVIPANTTETYVSESVNVSGNLTVHGTLTLFASTLTIDRNVTVTGTLRLVATSTTLTCDGAGTNYVDVRAGARLELTDLDGLPATTADAAVLRTDSFGFNGTVAANATLRIVNSRVTNGGWLSPDPAAAGAGFSVTDATVTVSNSTFINGWEVLLVRGSTNLSIDGAIFDGAVVAVNISGWAGQRLAGIRLANHTYGILLSGTNGTHISGLTVGLPRLASYQPPGAGPGGSGLDAAGSTNLTLDGLAIEGLPAPAGTAAHTGFQLRNCTAVTISQVSSVWGGSIGRASDSQDIAVTETVVAESIGPVAFVDSANVTLTNFTAQIGNSGVSFANVSGWAVERFVGIGLTAAAVTGVSLQGGGRITNITVENSTRIAALSWAGPGQLAVENATALNLVGGLTVDGPVTLALSIDGFYAWSMEDETLAVSVARLDQSTVANLTVNVTDSTPVALTASTVTSSSFGPLTVLQGVGDAFTVNASWVNGSAFHHLSADNVSGTMLVVAATGGVDNSSFTNLRATNTTGVVLQVLASVMRGVTTTDVRVVDGIVVPAAADAAVAVVSGQVVLSTFSDIFLERSLVGAINVSAGSLSQFNVSTVRGTAVSAPAVSVNCQAQQCAVGVTDVVLTQSFDIAVLLANARGQLWVTTVAADSPWAVWAYLVQDLALAAVDHNGSSAAISLVDCQRVQITSVTLRGGIGLAAERGAGIRLTNSVSSTDGPTVQSRSTVDLWLSAITFADAGSAVHLLGTRNVTAQDFTGSVTDYVLYASQDATGVLLQRVSMGTAAGSTAGVVVSATRVLAVAISDYNFTGPCLKSAAFQLVVGLDLTRFRSNACADGIEVHQSTSVNLTAITVQDVSAGYGLSVSDSNQVRVVGADLQRAFGQAVSLSGGSGNLLMNVNGSHSGGDGALLLFAGDAVLRDSVFDDAATYSLFLFHAGPNLTLSNVSASHSLQGAEVLSTAGVTFDRVTFSGNQNYGLTSDFASTGNTLQDLAVSSNGLNGIVIFANGTTLIDGNFSGNGASAILTAPFVRLDWRVAHAASLVDEGVNMSGDILVDPGATFTLRRSRLVIDQAARQAAAQPIALIQVMAGGRFEVENSSVSPRDVTAPYAIVLLTGARATWTHALIEGANVSSPLSAIRFQGAVADITGGEINGWNVPIESTSSTLTVDGTLFAGGGAGPRISGGTARFSNVTSLSNDGDGIFASAVDALYLTAFSTFNNGGSGARLEGVTFASIVSFDARANRASGLHIEGSHVEAQGLSLVGNGADGLSSLSSSSIQLQIVDANSNNRSGISLVDVASFEITDLTAEGNGGSGLLLGGASFGSVAGAFIRQNQAFGVHASGQGAFSVTGAEISGDVLGAVRLEGALLATFSSTLVDSLANYGVATVGTVNLTLTDVVSAAALAGLIADEQSHVLAVNCTIGEVIVVSQAVVWIGWHVRVVVQDSTGSPAADTSVSVLDAVGATVANETAGTSGSLPLLVVIERSVHGDGTQETFGPHTFVATSLDMGRARVIEDVTHYLSLGLRLDPLAPILTVEYSSTAGPTGWFLGPVAVTLRAFDDRGEGVTLAYRITGGAWTEVTSNTSASTVTLQVEAEGITSIELRASDAAGNEEAPSPLEVRVDLAAPSGSFGPADSVYNVSSFTPTWHGDDGSGSGVATYRVESSRNNGAFSIFLNGTTLTQALFVGDDADFRLRLTVYDAAGRASPPAYLDVSFALLGAFRVRVLDAAGAAITNTSVRVEGLNLTRTGQGDLEFTGLPAGAHTIVISAPGFVPVQMTVNITARQTEDLGSIVLKSEGSSMPIELVVLWGLLAGVGVATLGYWVYMRQKWRRRQPPAKGAK